MNYIRKADSIFIEYDYLKQINVIKDSEIKEYNIIVNDLCNKVETTKKDNDKLKKRNKVTTWVAIGTTIAFIITLIFK